MSAWAIVECLKNYNCQVLLGLFFQARFLLLLGWVSFELE
jgi:hypothetical protein